MSQFLLLDDRKTPNTEGLDDVSIETHPMRKGHCQRFSSEEGRWIIGGGSHARTKKHYFIIHFYPSIPLSPNQYSNNDKNVGFKQHNYVCVAGESPLSFLLVFLSSLLKWGIEKAEWWTACAMPELCVSVQIRRLPAPSITGSSFLSPLPLKSF